VFAILVKGGAKDGEVKTASLSLFISCGAFLISVISIILSTLSYRKDRWKLSLEAWIQTRVSNLPNSPSLGQGRLLVKAANIGRRALTIEKICLQVFEHELEQLRKVPGAEVRKGRTHWIRRSLFIIHEAIEFSCTAW
jgi:hypothetical protein